MKTTFSKLVSQYGLKINKDVKEVMGKDDKVLFEVRAYLPVEEKAQMLNFILTGSASDNGAFFSPLKVEVYFGVAICKWYAGISFTDKQLTEIGKTYDMLDSNGIIREIINNIPNEEREFITELVKDTIKDASRYSSSAAGIIQSMTNSAASLDGQVNEILEKIKNGEGLEQLAAIKDVVGKD